MRLKIILYNFYDFLICIIYNLIFLEIYGEISLINTFKGKIQFWKNKFIKLFKIQRFLNIFFTNIIFYHHI